jgi:hypothetical protein
MSRQPDQIKDGRPPFILIEEAVLRNHKLTAYQIAAYVTLVMYANHKDGDRAFPSHKTIGIVGGMSARQAKRAVDALAEMKLISIEANHDKKTGAQTSNVYTILPVTTPRLSVMGGLSNGLGAPDSQSYKPDEVNQIKESAAKAAQADKPVKVVTSVEKPRDVIFDGIASGSFGITGKVDKGDAPRVARISNWIKKTYPNANEKTLAAFYKWYDTSNDGAARPRDLAKFKEHFIAFHDEIVAKKAADQKSNAKQTESLELWQYDLAIIEGRAS